MTPAILTILLLTGLAGLWPRAALAQDCPVGTKKVGEEKQETATKVFVRAVCERMTAAEMRARVAELDARIKDVRRQLVLWRRDHLPAIRGELEAWEELSREARTEIYLSAGNFLLSGVLETKLMKAEGQRELLGTQVEELKGLLNNPRVALDSSAKPELRKLQTDLRNAKRIEHALDVADRGREAAVKGAAFGLSHDIRSRLMTLSFGAAYVATEVVKADPRLRLMFAGGEAASALLWGGTVLSIGREQVDQLSTVAGQQVAAVTRLATFYRESFEERAALRSKLAQP